MKTQLIDSPTALYWASFNRFELRVSGEAVCAIAQPGPADSAVAKYAPQVRAQMEADNFPNRPTPEKIREELAEYGSWDAQELADDEANWRRLVWCAACNIAEDESPDCSEPAKPAPAWTPGPWTIEPGQAPDGIGFAASIGNESGEIAVAVPHEDMDANARLIAAAPEMAEALRNVIRSLDSLCFSVFEIRASQKTPIDPRNAPTIQGARALLARINGEGGNK